MQDSRRNLPAQVKREYEEQGPNCPICPLVIKDLSDYFAALNGMLVEGEVFWFRGHSDFHYQFTPSALRYETESQRNKALQLPNEFRRLAEIKLPKPPAPDDQLKWLQLAQHYGLPTRLLDWTENAAAALYFACRNPKKNGLVGVVNPIDLNRSVEPNNPRIFDAHVDSKIILRYLALSGRMSPRGRPAIAVLPILNSERIVLQKGVFTLHGSRPSGLDAEQAPSLMGVPILSEYKRRLLEELDRVGVNEMSLFPELEHTCSYLKKVKLA